MSHVKAYRCDKCGFIKLEKYIQGFSAQADLIERIKSFPLINNPDKATYHFCLECYRNEVINVAEKLHNRKHDEEGYKRELEVQLFSLKDQSIRLHKERKQKLLEKHKNKQG